MRFALMEDLRLNHSLCLLTRLRVLMHLNLLVQLLLIVKDSVKVNIHLSLERVVLNIVLKDKFHKLKEDLMYVKTAPQLMQL
jgi:hypothetical protein